MVNKNTKQPKKQLKDMPCEFCGKGSVGGIHRKIKRKHVYRFACEEHLYDLKDLVLKEVRLEQHAWADKKYNEYMIKEYGPDKTKWPHVTKIGPIQIVKPPEISKVKRDEYYTK